jgi:hypothetical protein
LSFALLFCAKTPCHADIRTDEPEELVARWCELMSVTPEEANFFLSAANYNLEVALNLYMDSLAKERALSAPRATFTDDSVHGDYQALFRASKLAADGLDDELDPALQAALVASSDELHVGGGTMSDMEMLDSSAPMTAPAWSHGAFPPAVWPAVQSASSGAPWDISPQQPPPSNGGMSDD